MKIVKIDDTIFFDNGKELDVVHQPDCCESHWADVDVLRNYNISTTTGKEINIFNLEFSGTPDMIEPIEDMGFNLIATNGDKFFIPCYGENNGYYSTNLTLWFGERYRNTWHSDFEIDLSECQDINWTY